MRQLILTVVDYDPDVLGQMFLRLLIAFVTIGFALWSLSRSRTRNQQEQAASQQRPTQDSVPEIETLAQFYLDRQQAAGFRLVVVHGKSQQQSDGWWNIRVKADWDGIPVAKYEDQVGLAELELREVTRKKVILRVRD